MIMLARSFALTCLLVAPCLAQQLLEARFVDGEGEPVAGVRVLESRGGAYLATSDRLGRVHTQVGEGLRFFDVRCEGYADATWRVSHLGRLDVPMYERASLSGRILDARGEQWGGSWTLVMVAAVGGRAGVFRREVQLEQGEFRLDDLPATTLRIWIEDQADQTIEVTLEPDAPGFVDLVGSRRLIVQPEAPPSGSRSWALDIRLFDGDEQVREDDLALAGMFVDLHSGPYRLEIDAPGCEPYRAEVRPEAGHHVARLRGLSSVRFLVEDPAQLAGVGYDGEYRSWAGPRPLPDSLVVDLAAGDTGVSLEFPDGRSMRWSFAVEAGEELELPVPLAELRPVTLTVLGKDRRPVAGASVDFGTLRRGRERPRLDLRDRISDANGQVQLPPVFVDGRNLAWVDWGQGLRTQHVWSNSNVELVRPPSGSVRVRRARALTEREGRTVRVHTRGNERLFLKGQAAGSWEVDVIGVPGAYEVLSGPVALFTERRSARDEKTYARLLAELEVDVDEVHEVEIDPEWQHAGSVSIEARVDGESVAGSKLHIHAPQDWPHPWEDFEGAAHRRLAFVTPGPHSLLVTGKDATWAAVVEVDVGLRQRRGYRIDVERVSRTVLFLDEEGRPLVRKRVRFERTLLGLEQRGSFRTDEDGRAVVAMVPGEVTFAAPLVGPVAIEWGAGTEPLDVRFHGR